MFVVSVLFVLFVLSVLSVVSTRDDATAQLRYPDSARICGGPAPERFTLAQRKGGRFRRGGILPFTALKMPS